jgi:hypothetical protein
LRDGFVVGSPGARGRGELGEFCGRVDAAVVTRMRAALPEGVDELVLRAPGFLTDAAQLRKLFALFALILDRLCAMDSACAGEPGVSL